jgi:hypothetical protein
MAARPSLSTVDLRRKATNLRRLPTFSNLIARGHEWPRKVHQQWGLSIVVDARVGPEPSRAKSVFEFLASQAPMPDALRPSDAQ